MSTAWMRALRTGLVIAVFLCGLPRVASAQTPHQIVPVLTNQAPVQLSNQFGIPSASVANDTGDFAFIGLRGTGLYYRKAGLPSAIRAIQYGDELPGLPGSRLLALVGPLFMNGSGRVAVLADVLTTNRLTRAILAFDGTTLTTVVTGQDTAPGTGGATYGPTMTLVGMNSAGDVVAGSTLLPTGSTNPPLPSVFLIPAAGSAARVAGPGDPSPGTGGTFSAATGVALDNGGQVLLHASIAGGSGASGIFVWQGGVLRKVVADGDANPLGGMFADTFTAVPMSMNGAGLAVFVASGSLWKNTQADGTSAAVGAGSAAPAPMGGTFAAVTTLEAMGDAGDAVFQATVTGGASGSGLFRFTSGGGVEVVARVGEAVPGQAEFFSAFLSASVNGAGTVSFQGNASVGPAGVFRKPAASALAAVVAHGAATPVDGFLFLAGLPTQTLTSGAVIVRAHVMNAADATHAHFLWSGSLAPLMTTADQLPVGARTIVRPGSLSAAGDYLGIGLQRAGGRESIGVLDPASQSALVVATDGDVVGGTGGSRLQFGTVNTVLVNGAGDLVVQASLFGGAALENRPAILSGGFTQAFAAVMIDGVTLDSGGRLLTQPQLAFATLVRPVPINMTGNVAFTAIADGGPRGVFVGHPQASPHKVALPGDVVSTGATIVSVGPVHGGINEAGQVLFVATTAAGQGLMVSFPGLTPQVIAQVGDSAPGGGTFSGFGSTPMPGFNDLGQVAFVASTSGGAGGGMFLAAPFDPPVAIALNGDASPAGGTFAITNPWGDTTLNNSGHVAFVADLAGGAANSGVFVKRGAQSVELVASQGQSAPGTAGAFSRFHHGPTGIGGEVVQVSSTGQVAFFGAVALPGGDEIIGYWHHEPGGAVQPILIAPSAAAEFDGGTSSTLSVTSAWMANDWYPVWAAMADGPHEGGLYLYVPIASVATGLGTNVQVTPADPVTGATATVTFAEVTVAGETTLSRSVSGPPLPRGWYRSMGGAAYYNLSTTATFTGTVTVCIDFADQNPPVGAVVRMLHYESSVWQDVTSSGPTGTEICGTTTSLSPFVAAHALNVPTSNFVQNGDFSSGIAGWSLYATDGTSTTSNLDYISWAVNNGVFEYYRVPPPSGSNSAVVLQHTGFGFDAGDPIAAHFEVGNTSSVRKRISVLIHASDFSDLSVCTFWVPPNTPMRPYAMRTHTTIAWTGASISFYAASVDSFGGVYQLDNVVMGPGHVLNNRRTDCVDPGEPGVEDDPDGPPLLTNGDFTNGLSSWTTFGTITAQVTGGVAEFIRPSNTPPSGVLLQQSFTGVAAGRVVTATFQLGNSSVARKRVTVILHDFAFDDLAVCTFWLPAGQPLSDYSMRAYTTQAWANATVSVYPATTDQQEWFLLDNVALSATPSAPTYGTDCVEPGDVSGLSFDPRPGGGMPPSPEPPPVETAAWTGRIAIGPGRTT
jgi:hypothetical protein